MVTFGGAVVADTRRAIRVLETSHPPNWYFPVADVRMSVLLESETKPTVCEWKGVASYFDVLDPDGRLAPAAAWTYEAPQDGLAEIAGWLSFMPGSLECELDGEPVLPQDGGFYGGWITDDVVGPFKGGPGTLGW